MIIRPINVAEITESVKNLLRDAMTIGVAGVTVERAEAIPEDDVGEHGWVGVYRDTVQYPPRALGMGTGFRNQRVVLIVLVKHSDMQSGSDCEDKLEDLIQRVLSVLLTDGSFGGKVNTLGDDIEVQYDRYERNNEGTFVQTAAIKIPGLVYVSAAT